MRRYRLFWRGPALLLAALAAWFPLLILRPVLARRRPRAWRAVLSVVLRCWGRTSLAVVGCKVTVRGTPPRAPSLLVSNHLSYVDILVLAAYAPGRFVSKAEIGGWPVVGAMCRTVGIIFVDRGRRRDVTRVASQIDDALQAGDPVILFPEGTSTAGAAVTTLKPSLLAPAARAGVPTNWAVVRYETPDGEPPAFLSVAWWGEMEMTPHAPELLQLPRIAAELHFGAEPVQHTDRKLLARELRERMNATFRPMVSSAELESRDSCGRPLAERGGNGSAP